MTKDEIISSGLLELFVIGQTSESETTQVLQWKKNDPEVAEEIAKIEIAMEQYAIANAINPSSDSKQALFDKIKNNTDDLSEPNNTIAPIRPIAISQNKWKWLAAASFALLIASGITAFVMFNKYKEASNALALATDTQEKTNKQLDIILTANTEPLQLKGTPNSPNSTAKIFWVKNTGDVYVAPDGLPETPSGMQYQLWAIIDGKPVDAGMIFKNKNGGKYNIQKMKSFGKAEAFAITLEKEGGSPTPSPDKMYVISKIT